MAGHSKYANIKHRKALQDSKRTKYFTKITRLVFAAAKQNGPDIETNPALRLAVIKAKYYNIPKDRIEKAITTATTSPNGANYSEIRYEGYGPKGVAIIVHALTDNKNRTASEVRSIFNKFNGNLGVDGSVIHMFEVVGSIKYANIEFEKLLESAIEANAQDVVNINTEEHTEERLYEVLCNPKNLFTIRNELSKKFGDPVEYGIEWKPQIFTDVTENDTESIIKMIDALEDLDDVQSVDSNFRTIN